MRRHSLQSSKSTPPDTLIHNLRLLDLDEDFDYPIITPSTFSSTSPATSQAYRIRSALWIFYRLLSLWDRSWSTGAVSECFPPLEVTQQTELKLQIYRKLGDLKREGALPRDLQLRRTMLDDCKGPKFEELLACVSSVVLCREVASPSSTNGVREGSSSVIQQTCAGALPPNPAWKLPLSLAYRSSIASGLQQRSEREHRIKALRRMLDAQRESLAQREQRIAAAEAQRPRDQRVPQRTLDRLTRTVCANWSGDKGWADVVLKGVDPHAPRTAFLDRQFGEVWGLALKDGLHEARRASGIEDEGLMTRLRERVEEQNARLRGWRRERERLIVMAEAMTAEDFGSPGEERGIDVVDGPEEAHHGAVEGTAADVLGSTLVRDEGDDTRRRSSRIRSAAHESDAQPYSDDPGPSLVEEQSSSPPPPDPAAALASQIVSSVLHAAPTPPLSLAERTRMSMARLSPQKSSSAVISDSAQHRSDAQLLPQTLHGLSESPPKTPDHAATLAERTRQSMSLANTAGKQRALRRTSKMARVSNVYPVNQFETPRRPVAAVVGHVLQEEDRLDERLEEFVVDEEAAFKSRPRVAASPTREMEGGLVVEEEEGEEDGEG